MPPLIIRHATLVLPEQLLPDGAVRAADGALTWVGRAADLPAEPGAIEVNGEGGYLAPGLIDLQLNGAFGLDFTANPAALWRVALQLPRYGVTSFLPTIITAPPGAIPAAQAALAQNGHANRRALKAKRNGVTIIAIDSLRWDTRWVSGCPLQ